MSYKNLALNRDLIKEAISGYDAKLQVEANEDGNTFTVFYDGKDKAIIRFYFNKNGKTTIQTNQGKNPALGDKVAKEVISQCQIAIASQGTLSIKPLTQESFDLMLEYLIDECNSTLTSTKKNDIGTLYELKGIQGDKVTLSYYNTKTFMVQGCPLFLHSQIVEFLSEYLDLEDIVNSQLKLIKTDITAQQALQNLEAYLPNSYATLEPKIKAVLCPSLVLRNLDIELTDYSVFAFPALKGLEGYIKFLFFSKGVMIGKKGFGPHLREDTHNTLNENARVQINCDKTCKAINQCYGYYKSQRHGLFHADGVIRNTRLIEQKAEALAIINDVIEKIETSYLVLH